MARKSKRKQKKTSLPWMWIVLGGLVLVFLGLVSLRQKGQETQAITLPPEISVQQAYEKYQAGTYFLDVRTLAEWNEYRIPKSHLITLDTLEDNLYLLPKGKEIVVVCRSGNRSAVATQILREEGYNATSMAGGLKTWRAVGYPVEP